ncbi:serine/threonine protein kinase [Streptomyces griseocarneus]|nr:serine/threonine protein kinase [Streptomyces griseocarneus]
MSEAEQTQGTAGRLLAGRYRLGDVLGRGGMGTVWRATDETLGRVVAVKELRFPANIDEDEKRRLITRTLREAKAIARIRSAGAVTVYDVVHEDDRPWIVMELIEGRSLADVIREDGPLRWRRAAEVGLAVLDVLGAAHRQGILHRDVKPSNVLIADEGRVVLTDFGIAQVEGDPSVTSTGMLVGAPSYISPERARGQKPGPPADLWSLGGLLYAAVEGAPPYDKGSAIATLTAVMTEPLGPPKNAGPLAEVMYGLLAKDPEKRLDEAGARALLTGAINAPDERLAPKLAEAELETTQAIAITDIPEPKASSGPGRKGGPKAAPAASSSSKPSVKPLVDPLAKRAGGPEADRKPSSAAGPRPATAGGAATGSAGGSANAGTGSGPVAAGGGFQRVQWEKASVMEVVPRRTLVIVAVVVVLAVIGTVLAFTLGGGKSNEGTGVKDGKDFKTTAVSVSAGHAGAGVGAQPGADSRTAGYMRVENDAYQFQIDMPKGWKRTGIAGNDSGVVYSAAGGFPRLQIDFGPEPKADAAEAWREAEAGAKRSMKNYKGLGIEEVRGWQGHAYPTVADWAFERDQDGKRVRVLNRGFKVDDDHGYAIMITCEKAAWDGAECRSLRDTAFRTFTPED